MRFLFNLIRFIKRKLGLIKPIRQIGGYHLAWEGEMIDNP